MPNGPVDVAAGAPNPQSYTDNGDGTVTDNVTGLMWQQAAPTTNTTWTDAVAYCSTLPLGGHADWRMPSEIELVSLNDTSRTTPCLNVTYFPGTSPTELRVWSSTLRPSMPDAVWIVDLDLGGAITSGKSATGPVRCVRPAAGGGSAARYTTGAGTVYDTRTRLTWQEPVTSTTLAWADAKTHCAGLGASLGGTGWRLPTVNELQTLLDPSRETPAIDTTFFPSTPTTFSAFFWTASRVAGTRVTDAWAVNFGVGNADLDVMSASYPARCVR
jgi:formylglycine-generating enzyme required for sulfatase activity